MAAPQKLNRLAQEKSPYLLQHGSNPVDWYPWCAEAFDRAKEDNKPIFLSIGYSTCHWCHVMAHEAFENEGVAAVLNRDFISIKVDREERPDVDAVYMAACQTLTGGGGWPLTVLITPEQRPFFAGTYLSPPRLLALLDTTAHLWQTDRRQIILAADGITEHLQNEAARPIGAVRPNLEHLHRAANYFRQTFDQRWGGFGRPPKFPMGHSLFFLLRYAHRESDDFIRVIALKTLENMYRGGLFDHLGGGFARYATDTMWLVPHFEKMLYDNALLLPAYLEAYRQTGEAVYARVAARTMDFVLREMTHPEGGFYSAQDADAGGVEGLYYLFTRNEVMKTLGPRDGTAFCDRYDITERGNFEGKNIPNLLGTDDLEADDMDESHERLRSYRASRMPLHLDDKILTAWNGLMLGAAAMAGLILDRPDYLNAAQAAAQFIETHLVTPEGRLYLRRRDGESAGEGQLDDYAFYALGLTELHRADGDVRHINRAIACMDALYARFHDPQYGGFYGYASDAEQLITRTKETYDGALPSGNSAAGIVLVRLAALTGSSEWHARAEEQLRFLAAAAEQHPAAAAFGMLAFIEAL